LSTTKLETVVEPFPQLPPMHRNSQRVAGITVIHEAQRLEDAA
jgi:hypothetical protein